MLVICYSSTRHFVLYPSFHSFKVYFKRVFVKILWLICKCLSANFHQLSKAQRIQFYSISSLDIYDGLPTCQRFGLGIQNTTKQISVSQNLKPTAERKFNLYYELSWYLSCSRPKAFSLRRSLPFKAKFPLTESVWASFLIQGLLFANLL